MKIVLIVVPDEAGVTDDMLGDLTSTLSDTGLTCHEVEMPDEFEFLRNYKNPKYEVPMTFGLSALTLMATAPGAFADALQKDRESK